MRSLQVDHYTDLTHLHPTDSPAPTAGAGQVLVRMAAVGVNPLDWKLLTGTMRSLMPTPFPFTPGFEGAGEVTAVGRDVTRFAVGDKVYGRGRALGAELAVMDVAQLAPMPDTLSFAQAAAIPSGAQVAYSALHDVAQLQKGQKILVHGASGGVGQFAIQLAQQAGAEVFATTSSRNLAQVHASGVQHVINYNTQAFDEVVSGMDVVLNLVNDETEQHSWKVLHDGGLLLSLLRQPVAPDAAQRQGKRGVFMQGIQHNHMQRIDALVRAGQLRPQLDEMFDLEHAAAAFTKSRIGHVRGKIVLRIAQDLVPAPVR